MQQRVHSVSFSSSQEHGSEAELNPHKISAAALRKKHEIQRRVQANNETRSEDGRRPRPERRGREHAGIKAKNARGTMEDAFSPEGRKPGRTAAAAAAAARGEGTARAFASTGSGQRRVRPALVRCSVVMVAAGTVS